ncbi:MAG: glycoside hydrolase family 88 protein [Clostridiales bacterium]|nr:glycoside hydrolase family 88 protein [Clostridiales bacterium]
MKTEGLVDGFMDKFKNGAYGKNFADSSAFISIKNMYDASEDDKYLKIISDYMEKCVADDGSMANNSKDKFDAINVNYAKLLFLMYDKTGDEKYKNAIENVMQGLREYLDKNADKCMSAEELYMLQPFYTEYETRYDKKAKYGDIIKQFEKAESQLEAEGNPVDQFSLYMAALIDSLSVMSFEIYEKYRQIQDMFKSALKKLVEERDNEKEVFSIKGADNVVNAMAAYAIIKACRLGIVLKEKYAPLGMEIVESLNNNAEEIFKDTRAAGAYISAYGQYLMFKKESEED